MHEAKVITTKHIKDMEMNKAQREVMNEGLAIVMDAMGIIQTTFMGTEYEEVIDDIQMSIYRLKLASIMDGESCGLEDAIKKWGEELHPEKKKGKAKVVKM
jgi:hypothetical protein